MFGEVIRLYRKRRGAETAPITLPCRRTMKRKLSTFALIAALLVGIALGWLGSGIGAKTASIEWGYGGSTLKLDLKKDLDDAAILLTKIFSEPFSRIGAVDWLKEHQRLYPIVDADVSFVDSAILDLSFDGPAAKRLREVSQQRLGPFSYQVDTVRIGFPAGSHHPKNGEANVCESGKYRRQTIRLANIIDGASIDVRASSTYECPPQFTYPDIQLNHEDAKKLFGEGALNKYETALALITTERRVNFAGGQASNKALQPTQEATASHRLAVKQAEYVGPSTPSKSW